MTTVSKRLLNSSWLNATSNEPTSQYKGWLLFTSLALFCEELFVSLILSYDPNNSKPPTTTKERKPTKIIPYFVLLRIVVNTTFE